MRQPKTSRVPRTRAGGTWTEAQFWAFIRSLLRQGSIRWPPRSMALKLARIPYKGPNKRMKWLYRCSACKKYFPQKEIEVHHITPCGELKRYEHIPLFVKRLFCGISGFAVTCIKCHLAETNRERKNRQ